MLRNSIFILLLLLVLISIDILPVSAQGGDAPKLFTGPDSRFRRIATEQGLSSLDVWDIVRDNYGFMWFGTLDGLNRFDGYRMKVFRHDRDDPRSLSENTIRALYIDQSGVLWVLTWTGGLDRFDQATESFTHFRHDPADPATIGSDSPLSILQDRRGRVWVGTRDGGLERFDPQSQTFSHYQHNPDDPTSISDNSVFGIVEDPSGALWLSTNGGLNRFDPETESFVSYQNNPADPGSLSLDLARSLYLDEDGLLWVGTFGAGLDRLDTRQLAATGGRDAVFTHFVNEPGNSQSLGGNAVFSIYRDSKGELWVGTLDGGASQYNSNTGVFRHEQEFAKPAGSFEAESVYRIVEAADVLWFGTSNGVYFTDLKGKPFYRLANDPNDVNSIAATEVDSAYQDPNGILWVSTVSSGLNKVDISSGTVTRYQHDPNDPESLGLPSIGKIAPSRDGGLWLALFGAGLDKFDPVTEKFTHYRHDPNNPDSIASDLVSYVYEDTDGVVWVGTADAGVDRFDPVTGKFTHLTHSPSDPDSLGNNVVNTIYQAPDGALWVGTLSGPLNRIDRQSGKITRLRPESRDPSGIDSLNALSVFQDNNRDLWIGTWSAGLYHVKPDGTVMRQYTRRDGLPSDSVYTILGDARGQFWMATNNGISNFNPQSGIFRNFDANDGLPGNSFDAYVEKQSPDGKMFFGGKDGLLMFSPEEIQENPSVPPVVLTDFQLNNQLVPIGEESVLKRSLPETRDLTLSYDDRVVTFEFAALNYTAPEKIRYRYMLEGFDPTWTEVGSERRLVTYTNLDPGDYTYRVLASNSDGIWGEQGVALSIVVTPPWWETMWFRGALALIAGGLIVGAFVWQRSSARRQQQRLETLVAERTASMEYAKDQVNTLFETSPLAIGLTTFEGNILTVNPAFVEISGYTQAELHDLNVINFYRDPEQGAKIMSQLRAGNPVHHFRVELVRKDGSYVTGNLSIGRVERNGSDVFIAVFEDETANLEAENALRRVESERAQALAVEGERNRLARELHDSVTQSLYSSALIAETLPAMWERHPEEARTSLQELHQLTRGALAEMRTLLLELYPAALANRPLGDLLRQLTTAMSTRSRLPISMTIAGSCSLADNVQLVFYRIAQEAINNIIKHARATRVSVNLDCGDKDIMLRIVDDGVGFQKDDEFHGQLGLTVMRGRAESIGARFSITSQPGGGTTVMLDWTILPANGDSMSPASK